MVGTFRQKVVRRWLLVAEVVLVVLASILPLGLVASPASAATQQIQTGSLTWGFKSSWRAYIGGGATTLSGGVTASGSEGWNFPASGGTYDAETRTTSLSFAGSIRWQSHNQQVDHMAPPADYDGPLDIYLLEVTLTNPEITISADSSVLTAEMTSRDLTTWKIIDYGRIDLALLDISNATPDVADGATTWSGIPAALGATAAKGVFGNQYPVGTSIDPVSFSYQGDGGAPDLSEDWNRPGEAQITRTDNTLLYQGHGSLWSLWWVDEPHGIIHAITQSASGDEFQAYDARTREAIGTPMPAVSAAFSPAFVDPVEQRVYYRSEWSAIDAYIEWDPESKTYVQGMLDTPLTSNPAIASVTWDAQRRRGFAIERVVPEGVGEEDYDQHRWVLHVFTEAEDGSFAQHDVSLVSGPKGWNASWYEATPVVLSDGSLALAPMPWLSPFGDDAAEIETPGVRRILLTTNLAYASVQEIARTQRASDTYDGMPSLIANEVGDVAIVQPGSSNAPAYVQRLKLETTGLRAVDERQSLGDTIVTAFDYDPTEDLIWGHAVSSRQLALIRGGQVVASQFDELLNVRGQGFVWVDADHSAYVLSSDGQPYAQTTPYWYGYARFVVDGYAPAFIADPTDVEITLLDPTAAELVNLSAAASSETPLALRWQVKMPGQTKFVDIDAGAGETLSITATAALTGAQYRSIATNGSGSVSSAVATLTVNSAPLIASEPNNQQVTEGDTAGFSVLATGYPEPEVTWQRRVSGYWQDIAPGDTNFVIDAGSLSMPDTNLEQDGSLFRARLSNSVKTVVSRTARLTVSPKAVVPAAGLDLTGVVLEWSGSEELQAQPPSGGAANYFSAGVSDGTQATYKASEGDVEIVQVAPDGTEVAASYATRGRQTDGSVTQEVRLNAGDAHVEQDGSATVKWYGDWSINFYDGLVPFTLSDPVLSVDADGEAELVADLAGYASSMANPSERSPLPPEQDVTIATFSEVEIDLAGKVSVDPDYEGVTIQVPSGQTPQVTTGAGWGSWPQEFVDFHFASGLSSYWYSSGFAADAKKAPASVTVDFAGTVEGIGHTPSTDPGSTPSTGGGGGGNVGEQGLKSLALDQPVLKGKPRVGKKLRALITLPAGLNPDLTAVDYQWYAGGKKIKGADGKVLKLKKRLAGKRISVTVTVGYTGYHPATVASTKTKKVKPARR